MVKWKTDPFVPFHFTILKEYYESIRHLLLQPSSMFLSISMNSKLIHIFGHTFGGVHNLDYVPSLVSDSFVYFCIYHLTIFFYYLAYNYCVSTRRWGACPTPSAVHAWCLGVLLIIMNNTLTKHLADHFEYLWKRVWECSFSNTNKVEIHLLNSE